MVRVSVKRNRAEKRLMRHQERPLCHLFAGSHWRFTATNILAAQRLRIDISSVRRRWAGSSYILLSMTMYQCSTRIVIYRRHESSPECCLEARQMTSTRAIISPTPTRSRSSGESFGKLSDKKLRRLSPTHHTFVFLTSNVV